MNLAIAFVFVAQLNIRVLPFLKSADGDGTFVGGRALGFELEFERGFFFGCSFFLDFGEAMFFVAVFLGELYDWVLPDSVI